MARTVRSNFMVVIFVLIGLFIGQFIGQVLGKSFPLLNYGETFGINNLHLDLIVIDFSLNLTVSLTIAGVIGVIIALLIYRKL